MSESDLTIRITKGEVKNKCKPFCKVGVALDEEGELYEVYARSTDHNIDWFEIYTWCPVCNNELPKKPMEWITMQHDNGNWKIMDTPIIITNAPIEIEVPVAPKNKIN